MNQMKIIKSILQMGTSAGNATKVNNYTVNANVPSGAKFTDTTRIEEAREISLEKGQAKYRAYFVRKNAAKLYGRYQDTVNSILELDGFSDCIVSE